MVLSSVNLLKWQNSLYNKTVLILIIMTGLRMTALAAGLGAAMAGGPDEANAQATEVMLPHPEREIVINVSRVALETQADILAKLGACLQEGSEFADADGNGDIEADEIDDFEWAQADCTESAERQFEIANAQAGQQLAQERTADATARIAAANAEISRITQGLVDGTQSEVN